MGNTSQQTTSVSRKEGAQPKMREGFKNKESKPSKARKDGCLRCGCLGIYRLHAQDEEPVSGSEGSCVTCDNANMCCWHNCMLFVWKHLFCPVRWACRICVMLARC